MGVAETRGIALFTGTILKETARKPSNVVAMIALHRVRRKSAAGVARKDTISELVDARIWRIRCANLQTRRSSPQRKLRTDLLPAPRRLALLICFVIRKVHPKLKQKFPRTILFKIHKMEMRGMKPQGSRTKTQSL